MKSFISPDEQRLIVCRCLHLKHFFRLFIQPICCNFPCECVQIKKKRKIISTKSIIFFFVYFLLLLFYFTYILSNKILSFHIFHFVYFSLYICIGFVVEVRSLSSIIFIHFYSVLFSIFVLCRRRCSRTLSTFFQL